MTDYTRQRQTMVENQLRPNRIDHPRLLEAMGSLPREQFCPPALRGVAYGDDDIDLGDGRRLIEPLALARLILVATPQPSDVALVIGCDTGYSAAVLSRIVTTVFHQLPDGVDPTPAERVLGDLGCDNVVVQNGNLAAGLPGQAPFDIILLAGSVPEVPKGLLDELADGGRLAAVVNTGRVGKLTLCRKFADGIGSSTPYDARIPPIPALQPPPQFTL
jgi:protein-L-isoaspartate(D-aspartate) O-methyltransferase